MNAALTSVVVAAFLAFCRIGGCFMLMPGLSSARVPLQVRLFVAVAATGALLIHMWDKIAPFASRNPAVLLVLIVSESLIGALIGLMARIYVLSLQFMASAIATLIGYGGVSGAGIDEPDPQAALGSLISFSALMLLFVFDFHHEIIKALVLSYDLAPISAMFNPQSALVDITDTISESFMVVIRLGSPFIAYAILVNLAIGFVNKLTPQIPVYFISLPFVIAGGLDPPVFRHPDDAQPVRGRLCRRDGRTMTMTRKQRLKKLVGVQQQLKELHEMRRAGHLAAAAAAESDAAELRQRFDAAGSLSALFPEIYHRHIDRALVSAAKNVELARDEAGRIAAATARGNMVERAYRAVSRQDERDRADRERLDLIARGKPKPQGPEGQGPEPSGQAAASFRRHIGGIGICLELLLGDLPTKRHRARRRACRRAVEAGGGARRLASRTAPAGASSLGFSLGDLRNSPLAGDAAPARESSAGSLCEIRGDGAADLPAIDDAQEGGSRSMARACRATCGNRC